MKRSVALCLSLLMILSLLAGCGGKDNGSSDGDTLSFSMWIGKSEDSQFYMTYEENPVVKYLETKQFNGKNIKLNFLTPITGKELDHFNTLLMTDEYADMMDMAYSTTYPTELYEDDYIWDLTPYIDQYMPNYKALLESHPDLKPLLYSSVDGEQKILALYSISDSSPSTFMGYLYRRDWIVKYGTNPQTGAAFTCGYEDPSNYNTYYDDVVFPSGGSDPVYISDWEWMFEIFSRALEDLGITDGYCYAPFYKGFCEDGALFSAFGGGAPMWYKDQDGNATFGGTNNSMYSYLECMNNWYEKGWLDKGFAEHTSDSVYTIDTGKVHMGKIGMWIGRRAESGNEMDVGDTYTDGIMVFGASQPINDVYGDASVQGKEPFCVYQSSPASHSMVITNKVTEEELPTLLTFLDYLYSDEGGTLLYLGLNKEQYTETADALYTQYGLTEGTYYTAPQEDGSIKHSYYDFYYENYSFVTAFAGRKIPVGYTTPAAGDATINPADVIANAARDAWVKYVNTGFPSASLRQQFTPDESSVYGKVRANIDTYMSSTLPKFITGDLDIHNGKDWDNYCKMLNKYGPEKITAIYQRVYDSAK